MKYIIVFVSYVFLCFSCKDKSQEPILPDPVPKLTSFKGEIGVNDNSTINSIDHGLLICGNTPSGICILNITKTGGLIWRKDLTIGNGGVASGIAQSPTYDIFISGLDVTNSDVLLVKTNSSGDTLWTKTYAGDGADYGDYIIALEDGSVLICGSTCKTTNGDSCRINLMKINTNGEIIWSTTFSEEGKTVPYHLLQTQNGDFLITGMIVDSKAVRKLYFLKVNSLGVRTWSKIPESKTDQWGSSTVELSNGDLITCGGAVDTGNSQILILKTDRLGNIFWEKKYGEVYLSETGEAITINLDGTFTLTGRSMEVHSGQREALILKVDQDGNQLVMKRFGETFIDYGQNILKDDNEDNLITGEYNGKIFFTRTDNNCVFK